MSIYNYANGAIHNDNHKEMTVNVSSSYVVDVIKTFLRDEEPQNTQSCAEDIAPVDTSFFCTQQFSEDIIEKNIRQAILFANSKADACRRIMALEPLGYVILSNVTDERKAELMNPFAMPKYTLTGEDFRKSREHKAKP